jgi:transcriptional regulator GlxA family with amidase domain
VTALPAYIRWLLTEARNGDGVSRSIVSIAAIRIARDDLPFGQQLSQHRRFLATAIGEEIPMDETLLIVMLAYDDAQILDITGPLEVFARTSRYLVDKGYVKQEAYKVEVVAETPGSITTSSGIKLEATRAFKNVAGADTVLVSGGIGYRAAINPEVIGWLTKMSKIARRVGSICNGALILAEAGLLDGKAATTHWGFVDTLRNCGHEIEVDGDALYIRDGNTYTSAGVTAGIDLALALVEEDWGQHVALAVAQQLVMYLKRPGGQSQFSNHLKAQCIESGRLRELLLWIHDNLDAELSVDALAKRISMSPRTFARRFKVSVGMTPANYVAQLRLTAARRKLENSRMSIDSIAYRCGFGTSGTLRRTFVKRLGMSPSAYREKFRSGAS